MAQNGVAVLPQNKNENTHGQALTGKQEHCTFHGGTNSLLYKVHRANKGTDTKQISSASSFPNKSSPKSQSSTLPLPCEDSAHRLDRNLGKSARSIQIFLS